MEENSKRQTRARYITVFATFLAFMGIGIVDPILPVIAEDIGATEAQVEMLFTAYILMMSFMMIPSGILTGKFGEKKLMVTGLAIVTVFALLCGFSNGIPELSIFRAGWGLGNSLFMATTMTLIIALTADVHRAVGMYEGAMGLGMAGGPLVGGLLGGSSWRYPFFATGILIFLAFILVILYVYQPQAKTNKRTASGRELLHLIRYGPFLRGALSAMLYYYGFFVVLAYSPLVLRLTAIQLGLVFFGWGLMLAYGSAVLAHRLEDKSEPKQIIPYSLIAMFVILALLYFVDVVWIDIVLIIISGLISGLNNALFTSYVMDVSPYERGVTSGAYNFVRWLGAAIAPVLSGFIGHSVSLHTPFIVASVIVAAGIVFILLPGKKKTAEAH
ncbi:MFS transporter [Brevibacillus sp. B_LB10_24]|uniref:MFS transporter n=1 Tax=Brevibacillus sp. B_LB10_24 TaxID=3380645 RepID=UPI0038B78C57